MNSSILECSACGKLNRVPNNVLRTVRCGNCKQILIAKMKNDSSFLNRANYFCKRNANFFLTFVATATTGFFLTRYLSFNFTNLDVGHFFSQTIDFLTKTLTSLEQFFEYSIWSVVVLGLIFLAVRWTMTCPRCKSSWSWRTVNVSDTPMGHSSELTSFDNNIYADRAPDVRYFSVLMEFGKRRITKKCRKCGHSEVIQKNYKKRF